ncbi:MAG: hypothetical protein WCW17_01790 [Patescibacteria group bacterium]|jgi:hypothetical protein
MPDIQPPAVEKFTPTQHQQFVPNTGLNSVESRSYTSGGLGIGTYAFLVAVLVVALGVGCFYVFLTQIKSQSTAYEAKNNDLKNQLSTGDYAKMEKTLEDLTVQVSSFNSVVRSQKPFQKMFDAIKSTTYKKAKYSSFSVDKNGKIAISGITDTYTDLGIVLAVFSSSTDITNFTVGTFSGGVNSPSDSSKPALANAAKVNFSVSFDYIFASTPVVQNTNTNNTNVNANSNSSTGGTK